MDNEARQDQMREFIVALVSNRPTKTIPGGAIGAAVREKFPDVNMRETYGGVGNFIRDYCSGDIKRLGKQGEDTIFGHSSVEPSEFIQAPRQNQTPGRPPELTFWQVFSNPRISADLFINKSNGRLLIPSIGATLEDDLLKIDKLSNEDYNVLAREFLPEIEESARKDFALAVEMDEFWPHWSALLNQHKRLGILDKWLRWRRQKVSDLFESRLSDSGISSEILKIALNNFKHNRSNDDSARQTENLAHPVGNNAPIQHLVHMAIDKLSEEELRRIWLPIGSLLDALKRRD